MRCARLSDRCEGDVEFYPLRLQLAAGFARFRNTLFGQVDVAPAGEKVFQVPVALTMPHEHKKAISHTQKSFNPNTSIIE